MNQGIALLHRLQAFTARNSLFVKPRKQNDIQLGWDLLFGLIHLHQLIKTVVPNFRLAKLDLFFPSGQSGQFFPR